MKVFAFISVFLIVFCSCVGCGERSAVLSSSGMETLTVVIDPGHGGVDGGVTGVNTGVKESELNLEIAKGLKTCFESGGFKVVLTRETSAGLYGGLSKGFKMRDMQKRKEIVNGANADLMISVHLNYYSSPERRGAQVFFRQDDQRSQELARYIQKQLNLTEREYSPLEGDYYVLNETNCLAVLCECGFLSNPEDERLLLTKEYRDKISYRIYKGCILYLLEEA